MGDKAPRVVDATITGDGCLIVEFSRDFGFPGIRKALFVPETLHLLAGTYADMPAAEDTDFPGVPHVDDEAVLGAVEADTEEAGGGDDNGAQEGGGSEEQG